MAGVLGGIEQTWQFLGEGEDPDPQPTPVPGDSAAVLQQQVVYLPDRTSLWPTTGFIGQPSAATAETVAVNYLKANASRFGLTRSDFDFYQVTDQYQSADTGVTHIYLQQTFRGLPVANALANVNIARDGSVISASASFVPNLGGTQNLPPQQPSLTAIDAFGQFASAADLTVPQQPEVVQVIGGLAQKQIISSGGATSQDISAELHYVPTPNGIELAWRMNVAMLEDGHWYDASASAETGQLLNAVDWVKNFAAYNVFPEPIESPQDGSRSLVVDPQDPVASPFGWHDVNGLPGPDFFDTRGNNVFAQEDRDGDVAFLPPMVGSAALGNRPSGGPGLVFDFPLDLTQNPINYQDAAITNLFYWVNLNHDVLYHYGFDEASGNFQAFNYSGLGAANDPVHAFASAGADVGIFDNAFFAVTPDGMPPIISMFEWDLTIPFRSGDLANEIITHEFGHGVTTRLTGGPANPNALNALQSAGMGEGWSDFLAFTFTQKATDSKFDAFPTGTYVLGQPQNGQGVRSFPYSFDMTINPLTLGAFNVRSATPFPHDEGEIWAATLIDLNWLLVDKYGFDPDLHTGTGGNNLALQLVMDGLKLQPADPTFLEARNAILAADLIRNKGVNHKEIWEAFSRRGMGVSADDGGVSTATAVIEAFDMPSNPGIVNGTVWSDANGNGLFDGGEPGASGWTVFIDLNENGRLDPLEPTTSTDASGNYSFEFLVPGTFVIGVVVQPDHAQTFPPAPGTHTVTVINGQTVNNVDFGARPGNQKSRGIKWLDSNANGRRDEGERGIGGVWIYVDLDGDSRLDLGEPKVKTASDGTYQLSLDRPGTFMVREVIEPGWVQTFPGGIDQAHKVTVTKGALDVNFDFGNAPAIDFGDAPASYGTVGANAASHPIYPGFHLGATVDADQVDGVPDGVASVAADADDLNQPINDEDGVEFTSDMAPGLTASADVTIVTSGLPIGRLNAWIDFNGDGVFGSGEQIVTDQRMAAGTHTITFTVPPDAVPGLTYARFRYGYARNIGPTGRDTIGEVEDYQIRILSEQPQAVNDQFTVDQNSRSNPLDVLTNDITSVNGPIVISDVGTPNRGGRAIVAGSGTLISYTPAPGFFGTENFTYTIRDRAGATSTGLVTVTVLPSFVNPIAVDDSFDVQENSTDNILPILDNDFSGQNPPIFLFDVLPPQNGTATIDTGDPADPTDDVILYTPNAGAGVTDQFQYIIQDAAGVQDTATVTVHVKPGSLDQDVVQYRLQATDLDGNPIEAIAVGEPFLLQVLVDDLRLDDGDGDPAVDRRGVAAGFLDVLYDFQMVSVTGDLVFGPDYQNATSGAADVPGIVNEVGALQTGFDPLGPDEQLLVSIPMTANAAGEVSFVGDPADVTSEAIPPNPEHDTLLFEPPEPPVGLQQIRYINDTLTVLASGGLPVAVDNTFTVPADSIRVNILDVLANDVEELNPPLIITDVSSASNGNVTIGPGGADLRYTPQAFFEGTDQFTYTVTNSVGLSATAEVTVQVGDPQRDVNIRLETTDLAGNPVSTVTQGDDFQVRFYVQDIRLSPPDPTRMGVFAIYADVLYDGDVVSIDRNVNREFDFVDFAPPYNQNGLSASDATPNLIDELGAFQSGLGPLGPDEFLVAVVTFTADAAGTANFAADPADISPFHDVLVFEPDDLPVPVEDIRFGATSVTIEGAGEGELTFTNPQNPYDVNGDQYVSPIDVLWVINATNKYGPLTLNASAIGGEGEAGSIMPKMGYVDVNSDGYLSPIDALQVIDHLNDATPVGEGEASVMEQPAAAVAASSSELLVLPLVVDSDPAPAQASHDSPVTLPGVDSSASDTTLDYHTAPSADAALAQWDDTSDRDDGEVSNDLAEDVARIWSDLLD